MKNNRILFLFIMCIFALLTACNNTTATTYTAVFDANGSTGTAPIDVTVNSGESIVIPEHELTKEGFVFEGWQLDDNLYQANDEVEIYKDTIFTAKWGKITAQFSQQTYHYDKAVGHPMELPIIFNYCNFYYVEVDGEFI